MIYRDISNQASLSISPIIDDRKKKRKYQIKLSDT